MPEDLHRSTTQSPKVGLVGRSTLPRPVHNRLQMLSARPEAAVAVDGLGQIHRWGVSGSLAVVAEGTALGGRALPGMQVVRQLRHLPRCMWQARE